MKIESIPTTEAGFSPEDIQSREASILRRFRGRAGELAGAFILLSLVACGPKEQQPEAQAATPTPAAEVINSEREAAPVVVNKVQQERPAPEPSAPESAVSIARDYQPLVREFYFGEGHKPSGEVYGIPTFDFSRNDMERMLKTAKEMKNKGRGLSESQIEQLDDMINKLGFKLSSEGGSQKQILENAEQFLNNNG